MRADWRSSTWGQEVSLEYGKALRPGARGSGPYRVFGSNGPIGWTDQPLVEGPGVVLGRKGAYRGVEYSHGSFHVIDTAYFVVPKTDLHHRWLYYAIKHYKLGEIDDGSPIPSTTRAAVYVQELHVPPVDEQRAIASVLGALDDKIDLNRRMCQTLEEMARALFKSWFVDFDPVRAKMEGRDPGLPKEIADLFPSRLVDSELGPIPEGWRPGTAECVSELNPESWSVKFRPSVVRYIDLASAKWGRLDDAQELAGEAIPSRAQRILRVGDSIVGTVRPGNGSYGLISDSGLTGSTGFAVLRPRAPYCRTYVYFTTTSQPNIERLSRLADGGAYPAVRPDVVAATPCVIPPEALLSRLEDSAGALLDRAAHSERESRTLAAFRDTLLPKLISGELRVPASLGSMQEVATPDSSMEQGR